jgi:hypothetical protein
VLFAAIVLGVSITTSASQQAPAPGTHDLLPGDWIGEVTRHIRDTEYEFSLQDGAWSAPNRAHDLRSRLSAGGLELEERTGGAEAWTLALRLTRFGREGHWHDAEPAEAQGQGNRLELHRAGIVEWYVNDAHGLEQGFTLATAPAGDADLPVIVEIAIKGLGAYPTEDGRAILFAAGSGAPVLRYAGLVVRDAAGYELPARLRLLPGLLRIEVEDAGASYPVEIDPLMTSPVWTAEGDQAGAQFGIAVATAGDVDGDGYSDVLVGAPEFDGGEVGEGRAFVYRGSASGLAAAPAWTAESNQASSRLGAAVSAAGDVNGDGYTDALVGAPAFGNGETGEGRAYVCHGSAAGLAVAPAWTSEGDMVGAAFGVSVSTAGDVNGDGFADVIVGVRSRSGRRERRRLRGRDRRRRRLRQRPVRRGMGVRLPRVRDGPHRDSGLDGRGRPSRSGFWLPRLHSGRR